MSDALLPSPSSFFADDWAAFGRSGPDSNLLPSPLNFPTPAVQSGPGFSRDDEQDKKRKSPDSASGGEGSSKKPRTDESWSPGITGPYTSGIRRGLQNLQIKGYPGRYPIFNPYAHTTSWSLYLRLSPGCYALYTPFYTFDLILILIFYFNLCSLRLWHLWPSYVMNFWIDYTRTPLFLFLIFIFLDIVYRVFLSILGYLCFWTGIVRADDVYRLFLTRNGISVFLCHFSFHESSM